MRELLSGGSKSAEAAVSDGTTKQEFTSQSAVEADETPNNEVHNFRVLQLISAASQRLQGNEIGPRMAPILQHLIPELRSLTPVELAALCKALSDLAWQDSLVDLVLGVVSRCPSYACALALQTHADAGDSAQLAHLLVVLMSIHNLSQDQDYPNTAKW